MAWSTSASLCCDTGALPKKLNPERREQERKRKRKKKINTKEEESCPGKGDFMAMSSHV